MDKVDFFKNLGFGEYESKIIVSLIKLGETSVVKLSAGSGVPQNKIYGIMNNLEKIGLVGDIPENKFRLINLKSHIDGKLKEKEEKLKDLKKHSEFIDEIKEPEEKCTFYLIKGQKAIMDKLAESNQKVEKEIFGVQRNWKFWAEGIRAMEKAVKKGVNVRLIGVINKENIKRAKEWKKIGCKIKKYNQKFG